MKNPGRMENVTRRLIATLLSLSMVILFASTSLAAINCTQCHGDGSTSALPIDTISAFPSYRNITTGAVKGNHGTHSGAVTTGQPCARCHGAAAASYTSNHPILKHYSIQMSASMNYNKGAGVVTAFPQSSNPTLGTCSTVNCHFQTVTPTWGQTGANIWSAGKVANDNNVNCNACHATTALNTGAHAKHITAGGGTQVSCSKCHPDFNAAAGATAFQHATSNTGSIKMSFAAAPNLTGTVTGLRTGSLFLPTPLTTSTATCSNVYCHSSGNINNAGTTVPPTTYLSIAWNDAAVGCGGCHGAGGAISHPTYGSGLPATQTANSHVKHVENNALGCDNCHYNTTTQSSTTPDQVRMNDYSGHLNRDVNIRLKLNGTQTGAYAKAAKTCTNTYCHGSGSSPSWGDNGITNCATCHSANSGLPGAHQAHVQTASLATSYKNMSGNVGSATLYRFSCAACHSYDAGARHLNGSAAGGGANGPAQVLYGFTSATRKATTYNYGSLAGSDPIAGMNYTAGGSGTCATTYCHSDGNGGIGDKTAITWAAPSPTNRLRCNGCHASQDWKLSSAQPAYSSIRTQAHARHIRGDINTELNVGNGIACNRCHGATVSAAMNSYTTVGAGVLNKRRHVNKMRDYSGVTTNPNGGPVVSSGQFNATAHTCSNVYCHSNSKMKNPRVGKYANPPDAWNSGVTLRKCNYCHGRQGHTPQVAWDSDGNFSRYSSTGVPNYTSGMAGYSTANSHRQHMAAMATTDYSNTNVCYSCHAATLDSTTGRSANAAKFRAYSSRHTSGAYNVKVKASYGANAIYTGTMGVKTCSATLCHGGVSPKWGANTTNDSCTKCHGTPSASVTVTTKYLVAPPFNTSQGTGSATGTGLVSNDPKVGAHQTHLRFTNGFSNYSTQTFMCENCHGGTLPTDTAHIDGSSSPQTKFQRLATNRGAMSASWTAASLTCSVYCHNPAGTGGTLNTGNVGTSVFVSWTGTTYLGDTAKTETNCNRCHKSPGTVAGTILLSGATNHGGVKIADDCSGCHGHNGNQAGVAGRRHIDGIKYGGGGTSCDGCHSYDEGDWAGASHNFGGQGQGKGAHAKHIAHLKTRLGIVLNATTDYSVGYGLGNAAAVCGACHSNTLSDHSTGDSTAARTINFHLLATYKFGAGSPTYNGTYNTSSATNPKSCSNVSCHYFTSPNWSNF